MVYVTSLVRVFFKLNVPGRSAMCTILGNTWLPATYTNGHIIGIFSLACGPELRGLA
jgi:hypothetical protein